MQSCHMEKLAARLTAGWVLVQILASGFASAQVLTHGPVVGGVTDTAAQIFVRSDQAASVVLRYGTDPTLTTCELSPAFTTDSTSDFTKIIPVTDLVAETTYYLDVLVNDVPQLTAPYPSFTSFPAAGSLRDFKFVALSDFETVGKLTQSVLTFANAAATGPAFLFIGGDFDHRNPQTIDERRQMFKDLYNPNTANMSSFVPDLLQRSPIVHQWDDHDSGLNNLDRTYPYWSWAQQVYQEYVPSYSLPSVTPGIWQKFSYAQLDCFMLDCRSQRDPENDPDDSNKSMLDGNNLGATGELQWLEDGLLNSTAVWKIIFTSVVTNTGTKFPDGWAGYQTEWQALKSFITTNNIGNVLFISGDLHQASIDNGSNAGFPEMCVPEANSPRGGYCATGTPGSWSEGYYDDTCAGYSLVTITQEPTQLTLQTFDQFGVVHLSYTIADGQAPPPTATPTPTPPPQIMQQPANITVVAGAIAKFSVKAIGAPPVTYQWTKNSEAITGATQAKYSTPPTTLADNGSIFAVTVSNNYGSVTSNNATLTVRPAPQAPTIVTQPVDQTVAVGQSARFSVVATGTAPLRYQWTKNGTNILGAIRSFYVTPPTTIDDNGAVFAVTVSNRAGGVTSNNAILTVQ